MGTFAIAVASNNVVRRTKTTIVALLITAIAGSACAIGTGSGSTPGSTPNVSGSTGSVGSAGATLVTPSPGLAGVHPVRWDGMRVRNGGTSLILLFWSDPCLGVDHVDAVEDSNRVTVTLYLGTLPGSTVCAQEALLRAVGVALSSPLGGRPVEDGARASG